MHALLEFRSGLYRYVWQHGDSFQPMKRVYYDRLVITLLHYVAQILIGSQKASFVNAQSVGVDSYLVIVDRLRINAGASSI